MPAVAGDFRQCDPRFAACFIEEAQLDALGHLGKYAKSSSPRHRRSRQADKGVPGQTFTGAAGAWDRKDDYIACCNDNSLQWPC